MGMKVEGGSEKTTDFIIFQNVTFLFFKNKPVFFPRKIRTLQRVMEPNLFRTYNLRIYLFKNHQPIT